MQKSVLHSLTNSLKKKIAHFFESFCTLVSKKTFYHELRGTRGAPTDLRKLL